MNSGKKQLNSSNVRLTGRDGGSTQRTKHMRLGTQEIDEGTEMSNLNPDSQREGLSQHDTDETNRRLKHWEGSQTKLSFIKKELKRNERSLVQLQEQALTQNFPHVTFSKTKNGQAEIEIAIQTKTKKQATAEKFYQQIKQPRHVSDKRYIGGL